MTLLASIAALLALATPATPPRDWAATLRQDARALHDAIAQNHPGPWNRADPGFAARNDAGLALALRRAAKVTTYGGWLAAMRGYVAGFDDGHLALEVTADEPLPLAWPGFLTGFAADGTQVVRTRADDAPVALGAKLLSCDGVLAEALARANVGTFRGRWSLASQRAIHGGRLFVDAGNPFVQRPRRCRFAEGAKVREVTLAWRPIADTEYETRFATTAPRARPDFATRTLADGTHWFTMPSFDGDPAGAPAKALGAMIAAMRADRAGVLAAPRIVLDVRGNGGGSSDWADQIAAILWGSAALAATEPAGVAIDWRASPGNQQTMADYQRSWANDAAVSPEARTWVARVASGLATAHAAGKPLWREPQDAGAAPRTSEAIPAPARPPRVLVLTDWSCASACLDAVDRWTALGATQIGQETSADSLYMDIHPVPLPGGLAKAYVPMKVYRGRRRGSNVPATPARLSDGDMRDTAALERWVAGL